MMDLEPLVARLDPEGDIPPVDDWHPERAGEMDLVIAADGRWIHEGTVMSRPRLVRLLSTILRREADGRHALVTPVEKQLIRVEDCPFLIVDAEYGDDGLWWLTTNMGDRLTLDAQHVFTLSETPAGECVPEVTVRFGLAARLGRNVFYRLVEEASPFTLEDGREALGLRSGGAWHPLGLVDGEAACG
ncbi:MULTISPECIES: DUF1285 domain-containing protein [unclassified Halomonas]|uniref:DUF1285 domain-containing protein n=1 Tax=unclassified Halomonas TaxID=2609666 RepID=UPI002888C3CC|nr:MULTISPECIES: DUF1285 domain-containing protein [unclassified Halomonas]MDT0501184.1 DUF1285 domain-containing protein [Halomonas sp. PAR7]MDT0511437.1 DUF1285 domain-containing protein [Halomonas sp. LES1]MDT0590275.1 DUF1285 domain-containing protein [Halomonas sp. PAR8]